MTIFSSSVRRLGLVALLGLAPLAPLAGLTAPAAATPTSPVTPANPELGHVGRWLTDDQGRVVTLHGVNLVYKKSPYFPAPDDGGIEELPDFRPSLEPRLRNLSFSATTIDLRSLICRC